MDTTLNSTVVAQSALYRNSTLTTTLGLPTKLFKTFSRRPNKALDKAYNDFITGLSSEDRQSSHRFVAAFYRWIDSYMTPPSSCPKQYYFVAYMLDLSLKHANDTFNGLTENQQATFRSLVNRNNDSRPPNKSFLIIQCDPEASKL